MKTIILWCYVVALICTVDIASLNTSLLTNFTSALNQYQTAKKQNRPIKVKSSAKKLWSAYQALMEARTSIAYGEKLKTMSAGYLEEAAASWQEVAQQKMNEIKEQLLDQVTDYIDDEGRRHFRSVNDIIAYYKADPLYQEMFPDWYDMLVTMRSQEQQREDLEDQILSLNSLVETVFAAKQESELQNLNLSEQIDNITQQLSNQPGVDSTVLQDAQRKVDEAYNAHEAAVRDSSDVSGEKYTQSLAALKSAWEAYQNVAQQQLKGIKESLYEDLIKSSLSLGGALEEPSSSDSQPIQEPTEQNEHKHKEHKENHQEIVRLEAELSQKVALASELLREKRSDALQHERAQHLYDEIDTLLQHYENLTHSTTQITHDTHDILDRLSVEFKLKSRV